MILIDFDSGAVAAADMKDLDTSHVLMAWTCGMLWPDIGRDWCQWAGAGPPIQWRAW